MARPTDVIKPNPLLERGKKVVDNPLMEAAIRAQEIRDKETAENPTLEGLAAPELGAVVAEQETVVEKDPTRRDNPMGGIGSVRTDGPAALFTLEALAGAPMPTLGGGGGSAGAASAASEATVFDDYGEEGLDGVLKLTLEDLAVDEEKPNAAIAKKDARNDASAMALKPVKVREPSTT